MNRILSEKKMAELRANEFGFVFQQTHLVSSLTLFENVAVAGFAAKAGSTKEILQNAFSGILLAFQVFIPVQTIWEIISV